MSGAIELHPIGGGRRARWAVLGWVAIAGGVVAVGILGSIVAAPATAPAVAEAAKPSPITTAAPERAPVAIARVRPYEAFATATAGGRLRSPIRLWLPAADGTAAGPSEVRLFGVVEAPVGQVSIRLTATDQTVTTLTVPVAIVVRGTDDGVEARRVFRASVKLPALIGPASLLVTVGPAKQGDPDPRARARVTTTGGWTVVPDGIRSGPWAADIR